MKKCAITSIILHLASIVKYQSDLIIANILLFPANLIIPIDCSVRREREKKAQLLHFLYLSHFILACCVEHKKFQGLIT